MQRFVILTVLIILSLAGAFPRAFCQLTSVDADKSPVDVISSDVPVWNAAQDGTGEVWAVICANQAGEATGWPSNPVLHHWNGTGWVSIDTPPGIAGTPWQVTASPNGWVFCTWTKGAITAYKGDQVRVVTTDSGAEPLIGWELFYADADNVWIAKETGQFYRFDANAAGDQGRQLPVYTVAESQYFPGYRKSDGFYRPWSAITDSTGRTWFYTSMAGGNSFATLRGVLSWNGKAIEPRATLNGIADKPLSTLSLFDRDHLLIGTDQGIQLLDINTLQAGPIDPAIKAPQSAFEAGTHLFIATDQGHHWFNPDLPPNISGYLYEKTEDGWRATVTGLDISGFGPRDSYMHAHAHGDAGDWVGTAGNYLWYIPADGGQARHITFQQGFPMSSVASLFSLPPQLGGLLAISSKRTDRQSPGVVTHVEKYATSTAMATIPIFNFCGGCTRDVGGHIWGVVRGAFPSQGENLGMGSNMLEEWTGTNWIEHKITLGDATWCSTVLAGDDHSIWLNIGNSQHGLLEFKPGDGSWQTYSDFEQALIQIAGKLKATPGSKSYAMRSNGVAEWVAYPDGHAAWQQGGLQFFYWDGAKWISYTVDQVAGHHPGPSGDQEFGGLPFTGEQGELLVNCQKVTYKLDGDKWQALPDHVAGPYDAPDGTSEPFYASRHLPADIGPHDSIFIATDANGNFWFTRNGVLYRYVTAIHTEAPVLKSDIANPFIGGTSVESVTLDCAGNAFIHTSTNNTSEWVMVARLPAKARAITVSGSGARVTLNIAADADADPSAQQYSIDGGAWIDAGRGSQVMLNYLPVGAHAVKLRIFNRVFDDPLEETVHVDIHYDADALIAKDIQRLLDGSQTERNAAVAELAQMQKPRVRKALTTAKQQAKTDEQSWWIEAATEALDRDAGQ